MPDLQCSVVFVSAIKPEAADSDHKSLGDVVYVPSIGG